MGGDLERITVVSVPDEQAEGDELKRDESIKSVLSTFTEISSADANCRDDQVREHPRREHRREHLRGLSTVQPDVVQSAYP